MSILQKLVNINSCVAKSINHKMVTTWGPKTDHKYPKKQLCYYSGKNNETKMQEETFCIDPSLPKQFLNFLP